MLAAAFAASQTFAADVNSTWDGTTNNWTSAHWSNVPNVSFFPNDGNGELTYNAAINGGIVTLDQNIAIQSLSGSGGTLLLSGSNLLTVGDDSSTTFAGVISGSGNLTKVGSGTLTLSGQNSSYSGVTTISGGTLSGNSIDLAGTSSSFGTGNFAISNGAKLQITPTGGRATNRAISLGIGGGVLEITSGLLADYGMISGVGGLTKSGNTQLYLFGSNTYSGGTVISAGTITAQNSTGSATGSGDITIGSSGQLNVGAGGTEGAVAGNIVNNGVLQFGRSDDTAYSGQISGTGAFVAKFGAGILTLAGDNSYTGFNWALGGTLSGSTITNNGINSSFGRGNFVMQGGNLQYTGSSASTNRTFQISALTAIDVTNSATTLAVSGMLSNNGSLTKQGAGTLALTVANTYTGGTTVSAGTLLVNNTSGSGTGTAVVNVVGGTLGGTGRISGAITIGSGGHLAPGAGTGTLFATGGATLSSGALLDYDLANATAIGGGLNDLLSITGNLNLGGSIPLNINAYQGDLANGTYKLITYTGSLVGDVSGLSIASNNALGTHTYNFSSATPGEIQLIVGFAGGVWTGATSASWDDASNWSTSVKPTSVTDVVFPTPVPGTGATIALTAGETVKSLDFKDNYSLNGGDLTVSDGTVNVAPGKTAALGTVLTGNAGLTKTGAGALQLDAANSYTGDTKITGGTLALANAGALQNSTLDYNNSGGTLNLGTLTSATFGGLKGNQNLALTNSSSASVALAVGNNNSDTTYAGQLSGGGSLTKVGTGKLALSGDNSYTGTTVVRGGTLSGNTMPYSGINSAFGRGNFSISNGAKLEYAGTDFDRLTDSAISLGTGGGSLAVADSNANLTVSGIVSGSGSLTKTGSGSLTLFSAANTYSGGTLISAGTLQFTKMISVPSSGDVTVNSSATLAINVGAAGQWADGTSGGGTIGGLIAGIGGQGTADQITWNSGSFLGIDPGLAPNSSVTYVGNIGDFRSGPGTTRNDVGLAKVGPGTLRLTGRNTYSGGTIVRSGTLQFANTTSMPTAGGVTVLNSQDLAFSVGGSGEWTNGTSGGGTIGGLIAGTGGQGTADQITWNSGSFFAIDTTNAPGGAVEYSGVIGNFRNGPGSTTNFIGLSKIGSGTLTLSGTNSYSSLTTVRGGTLQFAKTVAMSSTAPISVSNGATLAVNAGGEGEWTNGTSGNGTIGGLIAGAGAHGPADQVNWTGGNALGIDTTNAPGGTLTYSGTIGNFWGFGSTRNDIGLTKLGAGKLTLSGNNSYTGGTIVRGGTLEFANPTYVPTLGPLEIDIAGAQTAGVDYGNVVVNGNATLQGSYTFRLSNSPTTGAIFHPQLNDEITFLTAGGTITGAPTTVFAPNLADVAPELGFVVIKNAQDLRLRFVAPTNVHFVDNSGLATQDWNQATKWDTGDVPTTASKVELSRSQAPSVQTIQVASADAAAYQVNVHDQSSPIAVAVQNGKTLAVGVGDITIGQNATIELGLAGDTSNKGTLATPGTRIVTVQNGGLLAGNGSIQTGTLAVTNGTLRPGYSVGHIDVNGAYEQGANGTLLVDINSASQFDTVNVTGSAQLGGTLQINAANLTTLPAGTLFPIVTAGSVTGAFESVEATGNNNVYFIAKTVSNGPDVPSTVFAEVLNRGDMNGDMIVDNRDFDLFAFGLMNRSTSKFFAKCDCDIFPQQGGDFNGNGRLDFDDIGGFRSLAAGMGLSADLMAALDHYAGSVPEPSSATLFLFGGIVASAIRRRRVRQDSVTAANRLSRLANKD